MNVKSLTISDHKPLPGSWNLHQDGRWSSHDIIPGDLFGCFGFKERKTKYWISNIIRFCSYKKKKLRLRSSWIFIKFVGMMVEKIAVSLVSAIFNRLFCYLSSGRPVLCLLSKVLFCRYIHEQSPRYLLNINSARNTHSTGYSSTPFCSFIETVIQQFVILPLFEVVKRFT